MPKTSIKSRYKPKYKIKSQTMIQKPNLSTPLPPNIQKCKNKFLSGSGFIVYNQFYKFISSK